MPTVPRTLHTQEIQMIDNSPIVEETRHVRYLISLTFDHNIDLYIAYLQNEEIQRKEKNLHDSHLQVTRPIFETHQQKTEN